VILTGEHAGAGVDTDAAETVGDVHFCFQAEDGIRDRNVTGVQTCALPIFLFFTNTGRAYRKKGYQIPASGKTARGTNIVNILPEIGRASCRERGQSTEGGGAGKGQRAGRGGWT